MTAAVFGLIGVVVGSALQILANYLIAHRNERTDRARKRILRMMLEAGSMRSLLVCQHVIGADEATTKRLLIEIGARASEDGQPKWGLISRNPFPNRWTGSEPASGTTPGDQV